MNIFQVQLKFSKFRRIDVWSCRQYCSNVNSKSNNNNTSNKTQSKSNKKYSDTILLPKTKLPLKIPNKTRPEHEAKIAATCQFDSLYGSQRLWRKEQPEYILHDGPPYANGDVHIGHAVNKVLKDITNRYKLLRGYRVNYIPGWDCHGLPIELKAIKQDENVSVWETDPNLIRTKAREVANTSIERQLQSFRRWGVMADWQNIYKTFDRDYIKNELQIFYKLYQKGFIYRDLKPIYWSPSSRTALAEAELEYSTTHTSTAAFVRSPLCSTVGEFVSAIGKTLPEKYQKYASTPVEAVFWTTTPWSLPANSAIAYNENINYDLLFWQSTYGTDSEFYIVASDCFSQISAFKNNLQKVCQFVGSQLNKFQYHHPWFEGRTCPLLHGQFVSTEKGTGLVHIAPAHGQDDFVLGLQHKLPVECYIDDEGKFDDRLPSLKGMTAFSLGTNKVLKVLDGKILHQETHKHPYPYDWRTKKPVLIKTSMQWFMDTQKLKSIAEKALDDVSIYPPNVQHGMLQQLVQRPYWCISRQRVWGVPIPVLYHKETKEPLIDKGVIDRLCDLVESSGNVDAWWTVPVDQLIQNDELASQYEKGKDIFDIWLDSGVSWHILGNQVADLYLEGIDQFNGWFHSSLLTSVALRGTAPYKNLFVHGFVVDETGKKMSKSLGNVVDPNTICNGEKSVGEPLGADVLRWWCATQGSSDAAKIAISSSLLQLSDSSIQKLRATLRYLVSFCTTESLKELNIEDVSYDELMYTDQYMLSLLRNFRKQVTEDYENYNYHRIMNRALHFAATEISAQYLVWIKDRLYCDYKESQSRKSCIYVLNEIYWTLIKVLAPTLPYLCEEVHSYYNNGEESVFKSLWFDMDNATWKNEHVEEMMELSLDLRSTVNQMIGAQNSKQLWAQIFCNEKTYQTLQMLHPTISEIDKCNSELCDILQFSGIDLKCSEEKNFTIESFGVGHSLAGFSVAVGKSEMFQCHRCRRFCCTEGVSICARCQSVLNSQQQQQTPQSGKESEPEIPVPQPVKEEILIRS